MIEPYMMYIGAAIAGLLIIGAFIKDFKDNPRKKDEDSTKSSSSKKTAKKSIHKSANKKD